MVARDRLAFSSPVVEEPGIVLQWLVRLRWLALAGQVVATVVAVEFLRIQLPLSGMGTIIAVTGVSNLILQGWTYRRVPGGVVPAVLLLDVFLLTALLLCAGGRANPFCVLYLVHVAMAVVTLTEGGRGLSWGRRRGVMRLAVLVARTGLIWHCRRGRGRRRSGLRWRWWRR